MPWYVNLLIVLAILIVPMVLGGALARRWRMPDYATRITVLLFCLLAGIAVTWAGWPPKLGIDLRGGVILVYEIDPTAELHQPGEEGDAQANAEQGGRVDMDKLIAAVARRVNPGGVKEVTIREYGPNQIEIIIPEANEDEVERMKRIISSVGTLEFRILANQRDHKALIERAEAEKGREIRSQDGKLLAWWVPVTKGQEKSFNYSEIATRTAQRHGQEVLEVLVVKDDFDVTGGYLDQASPGVDQRGRPNVRFRFNAAGATRFGGLTGNNTPDEVQNFTRKLGIILDGYLYSAPAIQSAIFREGEITGDFTKEEVQDLVDVLNAGSLPTALTKEPISQLATGPTLGRDTIRRGSFAIGLSLVLVLLFMAFYYRFAGLVACGALLLNLILILAIMITIKAAFTLPGLAGLVLTVGMAVDANVLIYERIREELDRQATLRMAIRNGFGKALSAIVDSNITTLITATILYIVGTDQIKGFAVTLWLGVVLSMFTAIYCARTVFDVAERRRWITKLSMMRMLTRTNLDFLSKWRIAAAGSIALILLGVVGIFARSQGLLDIDFTGGVSVEAVFDNPQQIGQVRSALTELPDLVVSDVQLAGEQPGRRFMVNTSSPPGKDAEVWLDDVKQHIIKVFGDKLSSNTMTVVQVTEIGQEKPARGQPGSPQAQPNPNSQSRSAPLGTIWSASAILSSAVLGQADGAAAPAAADSQPNQAEAATPEKPAATAPPAEKPAEAKVPPERPAETAAPSAETPPATVAASGAADRFAGGTIAELKFSHRIDYDTLSDAFQQASHKVLNRAVDFEIYREGFEEGDTGSYRDWTIKIQLPSQQADTVLTTVQKQLKSAPFFPSASTIGGKVAGSTRVQAIYALLASLLCIIVYLWVRFQRVMYGLAAVVALVHDVMIVLGLIALSAYLSPYLGFLLIDPFKIGLAELAAFLTIIGYSLNDTIIVFDRIREVRGKAPRLTKEMLNTSINQTLSRTLLTSLTTLLVIVILYIGGGKGIHGFAFALLTGIVVGTYSSIFVASPILLWMSRPPAAERAPARIPAAPQTVS